MASAADRPGPGSAPGAAPLLLSLLDEATDPQNSEERWDKIQSFCKSVNEQPDGPQAALRLLSHKIQSPQEREALQALTVLEVCMNECGKKFHNEASKFRFLNELIKVLSLKHYGLWTPQKVKDRVVEVLYGWTLWLRDQPKIKEAYDELKKQGLVKSDPKLSSTLILPPAPPRSPPSIFHQDDTAKLLDRLLKSKRPEDLQTANRLIKNAMEAEQDRAVRVQRREETLKEVHDSSKHLRELLERQESENEQTSEEIKVVFERCARFRPTLFRLASETMEDDLTLSHVLQANDELTLALNAYRARYPDRTSAGEQRTPDTSPVSSPVRSYHLIDFSSLDSELSSRTDSPLKGEGLRSPAEEAGLQSSVEGRVSTTCPTQELIQFDEDVSCGPLVSMETLLFPPESVGGDTHGWSLSLPQPYLELESGFGTETSSLRDVHVSVHSIRASDLEPIPLLDRAGLLVSLHFSRDPAPGRPAVAVLVLSTVNTSALAVTGFSFQAAVPKNMHVKLQPASGTDLPPYTPLLPPAGLSQVILLENPLQKQVRLRYKLRLTHGAQTVDENGEVDAFPEWSRMIGR